MAKCNRFAPHQICPRCLSVCPPQAAHHKLDTQRWVQAQDRHCQCHLRVQQ